MDKIFFLLCLLVFGVTLAVISDNTIHQRALSIIGITSIILSTLVIPIAYSIYSIFFRKKPQRTGSKDKSKGFFKFGLVVFVLALIIATTPTDGFAESLGNAFATLIIIATALISIFVGIFKQK